MRLTLARSARSVAALVVAVLVVTGLSAMPASAAGTRTISGHVYLGSTSTSAGPSDAVVEFRKYSSSQNPLDVVSLASDGSFTISALDSTAYVLVVRYTGGGAYNNQTLSWVPLTQSDYTADVVLAPYAELRGRVSLGNATTYAGAGEVSVTYRSGPGNVGGVEGATVLTDENGNFSFGPVPAGMYSFRFDYLGSGPYLSSPFDYFNFAMGTTTLVRESTLFATVSLTQRIRLSDAVDTYFFAGANEVKVTYAIGAGPVLGTYYTAEGGWYSIPGLDPRVNYTFTFSHTTDPGYVPLTVSSSPGSSALLENQLSRQYTVTGHVNILDNSRSAVAGEVTVKFCYIFLGNWRCQFTTATDANGNFSVSALPGYKYRVELVYNGVDDIPDQAAVFSTYYAGSPVWQPAVGSTAVTVTMKYGNSVSGSMVNSAGAVIPGSAVRVLEYDPETDEILSETLVTPDSAGHYSVENLRDGTYGVNFQAAGYSAQSWPGLSADYYYPGTFELAGRQSKSDANAVMYLSSTIQGTVTGLILDDFYDGYVVASLLMRDQTTGAYFYTGTQMQVGYNRAYAFAGLFPGTYKVQFNYFGPKGVANLLSSAVVLGENQTKIQNGALAPTFPITIGDRVKGSSSAIYLVNSLTDLVPLRGPAQAVDLGLPSTVRTVSQSELNNYNIDAQPLSNLVVCYDTVYLAAEGKLWPLDPALVGDMFWTFLDDEVCERLATPQPTPILSNLVLSSSTTGTSYLISADGKKRQFLSPASLASFLSTRAVRAYKVNDSYLNSLPTGLVILPEGSTVRAPSGRVYFVASSNHLVPFASWDVPNSMGLPSVAFTVTQADINQATVEPESAPLASVLVCASTTYFAAEGKLWNVAASQVGGLPQTVLSPQACSVLPKSASSISGALFVQSTAGGPAFQIMADGAKREVTGRVALRPGTFALKVAPSFLSSRPSGPPIQPFSVPPRPVVDFTAPAVAPITTSATSTDPRATCYSEFFAAVGASMYGQVATASDPQALLVECLA